MSGWIPNPPDVLGDLADVDLSTLADGDFIQFDEASGLWLPAAGGGGATELDDLTDVDLTGLADGDFLQYDSGSGTWLPVDEPSGTGGAVPGWVTHLAERMPDETPHADDDFFDDADHSAWTKTTVSGNATWVEQDGILSALFDSQTLGDVAVALYPLTSPSSPLTLETAVAGITAIVDTYSFGIGFTDGTTSSDDIAMLRYQTANTTANRDAFRQSAGTLTDLSVGVNNDLTDYRVTGGFLYMRIVWTTTNTFTTYVSSNGRNWLQLGSTFTRTMTPTHAALIVSAHGASSLGGVVDFHYLRRN